MNQKKCSYYKFDEFFKYFKKYKTEIIHIGHLHTIPILYANCVESNECDLIDLEVVTDVTNKTESEIRSNSIEKHNIILQQDVDNLKRNLIYEKDRAEAYKIEYNKMVDMLNKLSRRKIVPVVF